MSSSEQPPVEPSTGAPSAPERRPAAARVGGAVGRRPRRAPRGEVPERVPTARTPRIGGIDRALAFDPKSWRRGAEWLVRSRREATDIFGHTGTGDALTQRHARAVVDLALRVGEAMLSAGAPAAEVVGTIVRLANAYGLRGAQADVNYTSITVSVLRGLDEDPLTVVRGVRVRTIDFARMQRVQALVEEITGAEGEPMPVERARERFQQEMRRPHPYRRWVVTAGSAMIAGGVVAMFGSGPVLILIAALASAIVDVVSGRLGRAGVADFFNQAVSAAIPTAIAVGMYWLHGRGVELPGADRPSLIIIAGIIVLLAGLTLMGAAQDALSGYYVTAAARGLEMTMLTLGLAIGISATLALAVRLDIPITLNTSLGDSFPTIPAILGAAAIGVGFALVSYTTPRGVVLAAAVAAATQGVFLLVAHLRVSPSMNVAAAAVVAGVLGYLVSRKFRVPEQAITTAAIVSLLPGLAVYRALYAMIDSSQGFTASLNALVAALGIALGVAAGITIGGQLGRALVGVPRLPGARRARKR